MDKAMSLDERRRLAQEHDALSVVPEPERRTFTINGVDRAYRETMTETRDGLDSIFSGANEELKSDGAGHVTSDDLCLFAKNIAEKEIRKAHENMRVSKVIKTVRFVVRGKNDYY